MRCALFRAVTFAFLLASGCGEDAQQIAKGNASQPRKGGSKGAPSILNSKKAWNEAMALGDAVNQNDAKALNKLLASGADPNTVFLDGSTILHTAAGVGRTECVKVLLAHGADANFAGKEGRTPLHYAAYYTSEQAEVVALLLDAGADPDAKNDAGSTPLQHAIANGHKKSVALLRAKSKLKELPPVRSGELSAVPGVSIRRRIVPTAVTVCGLTPDGALEAKNVPLIDALLAACPEPIRMYHDATLPEGTFDIEVEADDEGPQGTWQKLRQACERAFGIRIVRTRKVFDVHVLRRAQGRPLQLRQSPPNATWRSASAGEGYEFEAFTMDDLADHLERELDTPVINESGVKGKYSFLLKTNPLQAESALHGLQALGLEALKARRELDVIVIEKSNDAATKSKGKER